MKLLQQLWDLAKREAKIRDINPASFFSDIGLFLNDVSNLDNADYRSTPINSTTFARTGGDGVHFGLLHVENRIADNSPVVMTVPMMFDKPNVIVGENLIEFLCLGCEVGYFVLEQIAYNFWDKNVVDWFIYHQGNMEGNDKELLQLLRHELKLKPWTNISVRLNELQKLYLPLLQLKEDD